jgi:hypothetical protein
VAAFSPIDAATASGASVGRYFATTNSIPSALLVLYVWLLVSAGAWAGPIQFGGVRSALASLGWQDLGWFVASVLAVSLAIHPLQFAFTQLLEGYWGVGAVGLRAAQHQVARHHMKVMQLSTKRRDAYREWVLAGAQLWKPDREMDAKSILDGQLLAFEKDARRALARPSGASLLPAYLAHQAYGRQLSIYPTKLYRVMPTRFGNALRQSEDDAGKQYGLDTLTVAPHLSLVADPKHYAYVEDRQKAMDLAITMTLVAAIATGVTALLVSDDGPWAILAFIPFAGAYASYLGAVAAARSYNVAIETVTDLSRFALYRALHVPLPMTGSEEQVTAGALMALLGGTPMPKMEFVHPPEKDDDTVAQLDPQDS